MKRKAISGWVLAVVFLSTLLPLSAEDRKASELLESALTKETIEGDLKGAIVLYEQAVKEAGANRALNAKAQLRLGSAYQKLGEDQARAIYERIVRDYADQPEAAAEARSRLGGSDFEAKQIEKLKTLLNMTSAAPNPQQRQITLFDRQGKVIRTVGEPGQPGTMTLSPDGKHVALVRDGRIFVFDVKTQKAIQLTSGPTDAQPAWSADSKRIAFEHRAASTGLPVGIYVIASDGSGREEYVSTVSGITLVGWSPDGRYLTYQQSGKGTGYDAWAVQINDSVPPENRKPFPIVRTAADDMGPRFSPDGRYVSYRSNESGRSEVYVTQFDPAADPDPSAPREKWKISVDPGVATAGVRWRADGKEIYYISLSGGVMAVDVTTTPTFRAGTPKLLFQVPVAYQTSTNTAGFSDVSSDGQIFALMVPR